MGEEGGWRQAHTWTVQLKQDIKRRLFFKAGCAPPGLDFISSSRREPSFSPLHPHALLIRWVSGGYSVCERFLNAGDIGLRLGASG
jgi:hypothetical protein